MSDARAHRRLCRAVLGLMLVGATLLAYRPALDAGFIWDDDDYVTENPLLTAPDGLWRIWFSMDAPSQYFPLTYTTFRLERGLWGLEPFGYHLVNVLLHAANALLLWALLARLAIPGAVLAAFLFALHPVHVESVAWITERKNVLSLFFSLLAVLAWCRHREPPAGRGDLAYSASLGAYALALFAKTTACTLPAALVVVEWLRGRRLGWRGTRALVPYVLGGLAMGLVAIWWERAHQGTVGERFAPGWPEALLVASRAVWFYLEKLVWPHPLVFSYPRFEVDAGDPLAWAWLVAGVAAVALLAGLQRRLGAGPLLAAVFFAATLSPVLGFIPLYTFRYTWVADHYQYVASIAPIALAAAGLAWLGRWSRSRGRRGLRAGGGALVLAWLVALGFLTFDQSRIYEDRETLWRETLRENPGSWMAEGNLARELLRQGRPSEAIPHYERALELGGALFEAHRGLARAYRKLGEEEPALAHFRRAVELAPDRIFNRRSVARALLRAGRVEEALPHLDAAASMPGARPADHVAHARALAELGRPVAARAAYRRLLARAPDHPVALAELVRLGAACAPSRDLARERRLLSRLRGTGARAWTLRARAALVAARGDPRRAAALAERAERVARAAGARALAEALAREAERYRRGRLPCPDAAASETSPGGGSGGSDGRPAR